MTVVKRRDETTHEWLARRWGDESEKWKKVASAYLDIAEYGEQDEYDQECADRAAVSKVESLAYEYLRAIIANPDEDVMSMLSRVGELMVARR